MAYKEQYLYTRIYSLKPYYYEEFLQKKKRNLTTTQKKQTLVY